MHGQTRFKFLKTMIRIIASTSNHLHRKYQFIPSVFKTIKLVWVQFHAVSWILNFIQIL
jgi:hypothetical protein